LALELGQRVEPRRRSGWMVDLRGALGRKAELVGHGLPVDLD
jgi:hypothetical protein